MNVIRDIDIKDLKEVFKRQIDLSVKKELTNVRINYVTALRILDVLEETQTREEKYQTIEIDRPVIGMKEAEMIAKNACDAAVLNGTQTNEMELHNKTDANGNVLRNVDNYGKALSNFQKAKGIIPDCFSHYEGSGKCTNCKKKTECLIDIQKRLFEEEDVEEDDDFI